MDLFRFLFSCIMQAAKIAIGVLITVVVFFGAGYLVDMFAAKKTAPPTDPRLQPYADHGMPLTGTDNNSRGKSSLYLSFFETLLNRKPDVMPEQAAAKKPGAVAAAGGAQKAAAPADNKTIALPRQPAETRPVQATPSSSAAQRVAEIRAALSAKEQHEAPAGSPTEAPAAASESLTYTLQLGSFQNSDVANAFSSALVAKGYESHIVKMEVPGKGTVYRVRVGKYKNLEDAQKMAAELEKKENISAFITSK